MFGIGMTELMVVFVVGLIVLGPKRLPQLARSLGRSLAEFRRASTDLRREFMDVADDARIDLNTEPTEKEGDSDSPTDAISEPEPEETEGDRTAGHPRSAALAPTADEDAGPTGG